MGLFVQPSRHVRFGGAARVAKAVAAGELRGHPWSDLDADNYDRARDDLLEEIDLRAEKEAS